MTFRETLNEHLRAIQTRDLAALIETLPAERLTLVTSDGRLVRTVDEFLALHKDWFASLSWSLDAAILDAVEGEDFGLAVLRLDYRDRPPNREPIHEASCLTLVFQRQAGRWALLHDQNTPIQRPD
jgi:ketosteroid isomerase-like protein